MNTAHMKKSLLSRGIALALLWRKSARHWR